MEEAPQYNSNDFSVPQRQSAAAIIILMLRSAVAIGKAFWPAMLVILFGNNKQTGSGKVLYIVLAFAVLTIIATLLRYFFYRFHIHDNSLIIKTGWLKKKVLNIPLQSIQAVHLEQNLWQQAFGVFKVSFDSAGSEKVEARIDALAISKAQELKQILLSQSVVPNTVDVATGQETTGVYKLSAGDLLKLSLSANHLEAFLILFALSINLLDDIKKVFNIDGWNFMAEYGDTIKQQRVLAISIMLLLVAVVSVIYSVFRTVFRYFDFTLTDTGTGWKISFGLLNRQQKILQHNKIQVFSWHANWLRRRINFWMVDIQTVGHLKVKEKQRLKIPLTTKQAAVDLAAAYQHSPIFNPTDGNKIERAYWHRKTLLTGVPATIIVGAAIGFVAGWQSLWSLAILGYFAVYFYTLYKNFSWQANNEGLQIYKGAWGRRYSLVTWNKVQQVKLSQSPYQRIHSLATVAFSTAGGEVKLPYIPLGTAQELANIALYLIESRNENWI